MIIQFPLEYLQCWNAHHPFLSTLLCKAILFCSCHTEDNTRLCSESTTISRGFVSVLFPNRQKNWGRYTKLESIQSSWQEPNKSTVSVIIGLLTRANHRRRVSLRSEVILFTLAVCRTLQVCRAMRWAFCTLDVTSKGFVKTWSASCKRAPINCLGQQQPTLKVCHISLERKKYLHFKSKCNSKK